MDTALTQKIPFILDRNLAKANCTLNHVCTSCDTVVLDIYIYIYIYIEWAGSAGTLYNTAGTNGPLPAPPGGHLSVYTTEGGLISLHYMRGANNKIIYIYIGVYTI